MRLVVEARDHGGSRCFGSPGVAHVRETAELGSGQDQAFQFVERHVVAGGFPLNPRFDRVLSRSAFSPDVVGPAASSKQHADGERQQKATPGAVGACWAGGVELVLGRCHGSAS